jgi:alanine-glyoxylate transaminase/serine-glyoxylate transaminase/serine-pyruvate transaminase
VIFPSSGTGAWEAALVNTLSPGDRVLAFETGHFATLWRKMAERLGLQVDFIPGDWRHGVSPEAVEQHLAFDRDQSTAAVMVVHNETSTGVRSRLSEIRAAMDRAGHPALLMVDTISSLASTDYRHDEWGVDVTIACSQKGLMLPPGLGFNVPSTRALAAAKRAKLHRSYWDWAPVIAANENGFFPWTPPTNLLFGLAEAMRLLDEEGLPHVFERHDRLAQATRSAVFAWGLDVVCADPAEYSNTVTAVMLPESVDAPRFRQLVHDRFDMSLGAGLGILADRTIRIGHLGSLGPLALVGALSGVEMGLTAAGVPVRASGVQEAMKVLA